MKKKRIFLAVFGIIWGILICLGGCGADKVTLSANTADLPFSVPSIFTVDEDATAKNGMLTFQSDHHTTLIVSCRDSTPSFLDRIRDSEMTEQSLVSGYKNNGLDVAVSDLQIKDSDDVRRITYTVHLTTQNGSTITRKYIRITPDQVLDLSCGGNVVNGDLIDVDYTAVLQSLPDDP